MGGRLKLCELLNHDTSLEAAPRKGCPFFGKIDYFLFLFVKGLRFEKRLRTMRLPGQSGPRGPLLPRPKTNALSVA